MGHRIVIQIMQKGLDSEKLIRVGYPAVGSIAVNALDIRMLKATSYGTAESKNLLIENPKGLLKGNCGEN